MSCEKVGGILEARGMVPEALGAYQQSLNIRRSLAAQDKSNPESQRDLSDGLSTILIWLVDQCRPHGFQNRFSKVRLPH
jgi:hypothetical protein